MIFFNKVRLKHRYPRRVLSEREQHVLKLKIQDRLNHVNYSCVFKPERRVAQKEGDMQFRYKGTNNKGENLVYREVNDTSLAALQAMVTEDMKKYPSAICFEVCIARPDPEVVEIKKKMYDVLRKGYINRDTFDETVTALFNELDIKLKGKDNA